MSGYTGCRATSARKSFTAARLRILRAALDQDTRMYHYRLRVGGAYVQYIHVTEVHRGVSCQDRHRSCLSDKYVEPPLSSATLSPSLFSSEAPAFPLASSLSLVIRNFTSRLETRDSAISRPTMPGPLLFQPPRTSALAYRARTACTTRVK